MLLIWQLGSSSQWIIPWGHKACRARLSAGLLCVATLRTSARKASRVGSHQFVDCAQSLLAPIRWVSSVGPCLERCENLQHLTVLTLQYQKGSSPEGLGFERFSIYWRIGSIPSQSLATFAIIANRASTAGKRVTISSMQPSASLVSK